VHTLARLSLSPLTTGLTLLLLNIGAATFNRNCDFEFWLSLSCHNTDLVRDMHHQPEQARLECDPDPLSLSHGSLAIFNYAKYTTLPPSQRFILYTLSFESPLTRATRLYTR